MIDLRSQPGTATHSKNSEEQSALSSSSNFHSYSEAQGRKAPQRSAVERADE